jgi:transposase
MNYAGIDLHKKTLTVWVVNEHGERVGYKRIPCVAIDQILEYFQKHTPFAAVVEATASYEWFWQMLEPIAKRLVLAHPHKLRIIAESTRKSDKIDARVMAEFLALDMIPPAYRPTPRQREHRALVRQRCYLRRRTTSVQNKIRRILSDYNGDRKELFTVDGRSHLDGISVSASDRFVIEQLRAEYEYHKKSLAALANKMKEFIARAPTSEAEDRALLLTIPGVGPITTEVVLSELADPRRFRSAKCVMSYAGLVPGQRESAGKRKELHIDRSGSKLLRWVLVEAAWQLVRRTSRWGCIFEQLSARMGKKKAIVAVARRLLGLMFAILQKGQPYCHDQDAKPIQNQTRQVSAKQVSRASSPELPGCLA